MIPSRTLTAALALALSLCAPFASSQTAAAPAAQPSPGMPKDPAALMQLAEQVNGLTGPGMKPWHVKATYQTFDDQGKPKDQGTFEEWWAAPDKDKRVYTSTSLHRMAYVIGSGEFRVGDQRGLSEAEYLVRERLVHPIPTLDPAEVKFAQRKDALPKLNLDCIQAAYTLETQTAKPPLALFPVYCFDLDHPSLRFTGSFGTLDTLYSKVGTLDGHYLGLNIEVAREGRPVVNIQLVEGNLLATLSDRDFAIPAGATSTPIEPLKVDPLERQSIARKIGGTPPVYPAAERRAHMSGKVRMTGVIGEDGSVHDVRILSAPDVNLAIAALQSVATWRYEPYLVHGYPVDLATELDVVFALGG